MLFHLIIDTFILVYKLIGSKMRCISSVLGCLVASVIFGNALACTTDLDCNLNGACSQASSTCACRPGWTGDDCGLLDFLPASTTEAFYRNTSSSWGGSVIYAPEDSQWHMFLAFMEGHCGLNAWETNSGIYHAVGPSPTGPFINETMILSYFSHNPTVTHAPDGTYLVWHIGCGSGSNNYNANCTNGTTPPPPPPPPVKLMNGNSCLVPNGSFPCWSGPTGNVCPMVLGDCTSPSAEWEVSGNVWTSAEYSPAQINLDCNTCSAGTLAKLFGAGDGSGLAYDSNKGQVTVTSCPGMCLSTGQLGGGRAPCGGNGEPWSPTQVQVAPCNQADTFGWKVQNGAEPRSAASFPAGCTDVNALVSTTGVWGPYVDSGILQGNRVAPIYELDNPAPWHFANGSTWVMGRSWHPPGNTTTPIGIARSDTLSWNTTYTIENVTYPQFASVNATEPSYIPLEDPFLWVDEASSTFHALFHNMGGCATVGCHAFSPDGYTWYMASTGAYTTTVMYEDGSNKTVARRERPHLVFNSAGEPAFLTNGVQDSWSADHTYTHVHPINVKWP